MLFVRKVLYLRGVVIYKPLLLTELKVQLLYVLLHRLDHERLVAEFKLKV